MPSLKPALETVAFERIPFVVSSAPRMVYRNTRNALFETTRADGSAVMIKRALPNPLYPRLRTVSFYLRNFVKHYGKRAARGAKELSASGLFTVTPVAFWKERTGIFCYESCFAYRKIHAMGCVRDLPDEQREHHVAMLFLCRQLHSAGLLHGDLVANNFLVAENGALVLIDTDKVKRNIWPGLLGELRAMHCFRRIPFDIGERESFLREYFGTRYHPVHHWALEFWRWLDRRPLSRLRRKTIGLIRLLVLEQLSKFLQQRHIV